MRRAPLLLAFAAASCTPAAPVRQAATAPAPPATGAALLAKLDLAVPADVANQALPPLVAPARTLPLAAPAFVAGLASDDDAARARDCLTAAIYYEARSEPAAGQRAVAQVVLNRVRDRAFPASVCGVVFQGAQRRTGCQFSFTCDGSMAAPRDWLAWARAEAVAQGALAGDVYAPVGSATHYHTTAILPWWAPSLARIGVVGSHVFYRWASGMERALAFRQQYAGIEPVIDAGRSAGVALDATGGVAVHYGAGDVAGVTVHRGTAAGPVPAVARSYSASGVRIHVGAAVAAPVPSREDGALVGEEI